MIHFKKDGEYFKLGLNLSLAPYGLLLLGYGLTLRSVRHSQQDCAYAYTDHHASCGQYSGSTSLRVTCVVITSR